MERNKKSPRTKGEFIWDGRGERGDDARYSFIPAPAATDLNLTCLHFRILAFLGRFNEKMGWCRLSQTGLGKRFGVRRQAVNKAVGELVEWGYLEKRSQEESGESFCLYRTVIDQPADAGGVSGKADTPRRKGVSATADTSVRSRRTPVSPRKDTLYRSSRPCTKTNPSTTPQPEARLPDENSISLTDGFAPGTPGGDTLIPFDHVSAHGALERGAELAAREATGIEADRFAVSAKFRTRCHRLNVDPIALLKRFVEKTRGQHIDNPAAYLTTVLHEEVAEREGVSITEVATWARAPRQRERAHRAEGQLMALGKREPARASDALRNLLARERHEH